MEKVRLFLHIFKYPHHIRDYQEITLVVEGVRFDTAHLICVT